MPDLQTEMSKKVLPNLINLKPKVLKIILSIFLNSIMIYNKFNN